MKIIKNPLILHKNINKLRDQRKSIALVPTMGNLHDGHMNLIYEARNKADVVVVSIFINPIQFDSLEDFKRYPNTIKEDCIKLNNICVDFIFAPNLLDIYPNGIKNIAYVDIPSISTILEGLNRPKHFRGVSTIVSKLFNLIQPNIAIFGEKDYQQLFLIKKMVFDMNYYINIFSIPIIRATDGLALSSRNNQLTDVQRQIAPFLNKTINNIAKNLYLDKFNIEEIIKSSQKNINNKGFHNTLIYIRDADSLTQIKENSKRVIIMVSSWLGNTRLIDNKIINL